jgi:hypothetical protein
MSRRSPQESTSSPLPPAKYRTRPAITASIFAGVTKETEITNKLSEELGCGNLVDRRGRRLDTRPSPNRPNLLALNATIEAGARGYTPVAVSPLSQAVKTLAGQTSKATQDIQQQISALQTAAGASVNALRNIRKQILAGQEITESINETVSRHSSFAHRDRQEHARDHGAKPNRIYRAHGRWRRPSSSPVESTTSVIDLARDLDAEAKRISAEADSFSRRCSGREDRRRLRPASVATSCGRACIDMGAPAAVGDDGRADNAV